MADIRDKSGYKIAWAHLIGQISLGRFDAVDDGWLVAGRRTNFSFITQPRSEDIPWMVSLVLGKRQYVMFGADA
jgi:hypothetical protein